MESRTREVEMSSPQTDNQTAAEGAAAGTVDLKLEVVVIPVSDVDRAKEFYGQLGWRLDADFAFDDGVPDRPAHPAGLRLLDPVRHQAHAAVARVCRGPLPDRVRHRGCATAAPRPRGRGRGGVPRRSGRREVRAGRERQARRARRRITAPMARSRRSSIPTATAGFSRRSRRGFPAGSIPQSHRSVRRMTWPLRCAVRPPPTASMRSATAASSTRTGPTGTPRTWSAEQAGEELPE